MDEHQVDDNDGWSLISLGSLYEASIGAMFAPKQADPVLIEQIIDSFRLWHMRQMCFNVMDEIRAQGLPEILG